MIWSKLFKREKPLEPLKTSPGKLRTYVQCPRKYRFLYVDQKKGKFVSTAHLKFDSMMNRAVELFQKALFQGQCDIPRDALWQEIEKQWNPDAFDEDGTVFREAAEKAAEQTTQWFQNKAGTLIPYRGGAAIGVFAAWRPFPITVNTRLDRIEKRQDGNLRVVDFKTGARQITETEMKYDLGLRLQAAAAQEQFGRDVQSMALVYLRTGQMIEIPLADLDLDTLETELLDLARRIQEEGFPPNRGPLCSVCEFINECQGWKKLPWDTIGESRSEYKNRLRLSYSKMSLFERCPRSYRKLYVDGVAPNPQPFFSFGSCIHAIMEDFYAKSETRKRTVDLLMELMEKRWRAFRIGYKSPEEEADYKANAEKMLKAYFNSFVNNQSFQPAAAIEDYFEIPVGDDSVMTGFIDRIDKLPGGGYAVLDYKTEPTDRSQESVDADLQLTLYYWAARETLGFDIRWLGLLMMSHDKLVKTTRTPENIPELLERIQNVTKQIRKETAFAPKKNKYCLSCDHLNGCPLEADVKSDVSLRTMEFTDEDGTLDEQEL